MTVAQTRLRTVAVVLAGGTGSRLGLTIPKQLLKIAGKTIIEHTIDAFERHPDIDEILVMMAVGHTAQARRIVDRGGYRKVLGVLDGGAERSDSTAAAIKALTERYGPSADCNVLFHDAVRPLVEPKIISECAAALRTYSAVDVAITSADTVIVVDEADVITEIPPRSRMRRGQTPQGFRLSVIRRAYDIAYGDPDFAASPPTDDCGVVLRYLPDTPIYVVAGSEHNIKVTHPVDLHIADKLFQLASQAAPPPVEPDVYRRRLAGKTMVVFGGSSGIGAGICQVATRFGARVFSFSRTQTGTHVESAADIAAALRQAYDATGRIDFVVNTAGVLPMGKLAETGQPVIEEAIRVNYLAPVIMAQAAVGYLAATGGHLLLYTSSSYTRGRAGYSLYSSTKAAVVNLTQALADEWSDIGVKVNCVNPERTQTPMRLRAFGAEQPGTLLSPAAVALTSIDVLVSELTGHVIDVRLIDPLTGPRPHQQDSAAPGAYPAPAGADVLAPAAGAESLRLPDDVARDQRQGGKCGKIIGSPRSSAWCGWRAQQSCWLPTRCCSPWPSCRRAPRAGCRGAGSSSPWSSSATWLRCGHGASYPSWCTRSTGSRPGHSCAGYSVSWP
jgi:ribitol-5-phosphate 2-dehydrogenase (NADP+) / D-ribitol-5-phosphate cytidylyltransferase